MNKQLFGTVEPPGKHTSVTLCRDVDEPTKWMLHCYGGNEPPLAVLANAEASGAGQVSLTPRNVFRENDGGSMFLPRLTEEESRRVFGAHAVLDPHDGGFVGTWRDVDGVEQRIVLAPPQDLTVEAERCNTWAEYKDWAMMMRRERGAAIFRGHGNNAFRLQTTLHRSGIQRIDRYCASMLRDFHSHAEAHLNMRFDLEDGSDYGTVLGLAQHHGLPTPLLDWTDSPYIAAFSPSLTPSTTWRPASRPRIFASTL